MSSIRCQQFPPGPSGPRLPESMSQPDDARRLVGEGSPSSGVVRHDESRQSRQGKRHSALLLMQRWENGTCRGDIGGS